MQTVVVTRPPTLARAMAREARSSRVVLTPTGLASSHDGNLQHLAWPDVVGVMREDDGVLVVFGRGGQAISIGLALYRHGQRLIDATFDNVAGSLIYAGPPEPGQPD